MVGHWGSSAGSYLANPTSPIPSHCASIVVTSTLRVKRGFLHITGLLKLTNVAFLFLPAMWDSAQYGVALYMANYDIGILGMPVTQFGATCTKVINRTNGIEQAYIIQ